VLAGAEAVVAARAAADPRRRGGGAFQAGPRRDRVRLRPARKLVGGGRGRRHGHVPAGHREPLLEHRLRHPRPDRRPGRRQAPGHALREQIFEPLGLHATAYDPQGPIRGPHAHGYAIEPDRAQTDATDWHWGVGAEGGIVSDAEDTATFLTALMRGRLLDRSHVAAMEGDDLWRGGAPSRCAGQAYGWSGGASGYKTDVWVNDGGGRVAVLLLNARHLSTAQPDADQAAHDTLARLYCGA
jgi:hypothetical protein